MMLIQIIHRRRCHKTGSPFVVAGLTNYWNSTAQIGSEGFVIDVVGGQNAAHQNTPTYDATTRLWTYNGTNQQSFTATGITPPSPSGFSIECVFVLTSTTPNFPRPFGIVGSGGSVFLFCSTLSPEASIFGGASTFFGHAMTLGAVTHFVMVGNGDTTTTLYQNGVQKAGPAYTWAAITLMRASFGVLTGGSQWFNGKAGWMRYYAAKALSAADVAKNYAHAKTLFPTLP